MELSHTRGIAPAPFNHLVQIMRQHPLLFYFLIAFGLSWAYELLVFGVLHIPFRSSLLWPLLLTLVGPTVAAFLMMAVTQGRAGILQLLRSYVRWRVGIPWYLLVLLGIPVLLLPLFLLVPGYNGAGTGFLGILIPFVAFVITIIAYTVLFTWVFNNTRGSLLLAILLHASINTAPAMLPLLFPSLEGTPLIGLSTMLAWIVVAVLLIAATRGRLSYQRYLRETAQPAPLTDREQEKGEVRVSV